jgi:hypothetical protein
VVGEGSGGVEQGEGSLVLGVFAGPPGPDGFLGGAGVLRVAAQAGEQPDGRVQEQPAEVVVGEGVVEEAGGLVPVAEFDERDR